MQAIIARYMAVNGAPESIPFETFEGAETIRVAVTGDLPPIDYVAADGKAAGFNTALLAEIAKRLKDSITLIGTFRCGVLVSGQRECRKTA